METFTEKANLNGKATSDRRLWLSCFIRCSLSKKGDTEGVMDILNSDPTQTISCVRNSLAPNYCLGLYIREYSWWERFQAQV